MLGGGAGADLLCYVMLERVPIRQLGLSVVYYILPQSYYVKTPRTSDPAHCNCIFTTIQSVYDMTNIESFEAPKTLPAFSWLRPDRGEHIL